MHFVSLGSAAMLVGCLLPIPAQATLSKPALRPNVAKYDAGNTDTLKSKSFTSKAWPSDQIAEDCKTIVKKEGLSVDAVTTYDVKYADCAQTWVLCRHSHSPLSTHTIFDLWGRLPVRMRQSVKSAVFLPNVNNGAAAYTVGQNQAYFDNQNTMNVRIHETIHAMDFSDAFHASAPLDANNAWLNAYKKDADVVSDYARTNQVENLAETGVLAVYSEVVKNGIGSIEPDKDKIINQVEELKYQMKYGKHGGYLYSNTDTARCTTRWANPRSVSKSSSSRIMRRVDDSLEVQRVRARADGIILYDDINAVTSTTEKTVCYFNQTHADHKH